MRRIWIAALALAGSLFAQSPPSSAIERIQSSLLLRVSPNSEPAKTASMADRLAALQVPGVSVAMIHDGRIEWERGFGVPPGTLFQAASISKPDCAERSASAGSGTYSIHALLDTGWEPADPADRARFLVGSAPGVEPAVRRR